MKIHKLTVELMVEDVERSMDLYITLLGFEIVVAMPEENPFFVILKNEAVELMLYAKKQFSEEIPKFSTQSTGGTVALYVETEKIEDLYASLKEKVLIIQELHTTSYGTKEFSFEDNDGYVLMCGERMK